MLYDEENEKYCMYRNGHGRGDVSTARAQCYMVHFYAYL